MPSNTLELQHQSAVCLPKLEFCVQVSVADFSGYLSRLSTPRELMIMMTEMFARYNQQHVHALQHKHVMLLSSITVQTPCICIYS